MACLVMRMYGLACFVLYCLALFEFVFLSSFATSSVVFGLTKGQGQGQGQGQGKYRDRDKDKDNNKEIEKEKEKEKAKAKAKAKEKEKAMYLSLPFRLLVSGQS
jgi:hypothetical protein